MDKIPMIIKRFRQSVLSSAVTGKLTEKWRIENPDINNAKNLLKKIKDFRLKNVETKRELNTIIKNYTGGDNRLKTKIPPDVMPENWQFCEINSIGNVYNGSTPSRKVKKYWTGNINWVSSGEVKNSLITSTKEKISTEGFANSSVRLFPKGSILIAMIGEGKTRGQAAVLNIESTCNQNVAAVIINHGFVQSKYLFYWFLMQYELTRLVGSGSGPKALNCQRVRELSFYFPPLEEQREIVRQVDRLFTIADKLESHYKNAKEKIDKLSQSVLAKAFRGELVPQDSDDEPAEKLLARIQTEKLRMEAELKKMKKGAKQKKKLK